MQATLPIGDFARATHLSIKTLRHYHQAGLLEPAHVDPRSGYRRYTADQIPTAQVIRRFRALDMPIDGIRAVLAAPDVPTRNALIAAHLGRLEDELARTRDAVASLRDLLEHPEAARQAPVRHRRVEAATAAAITDIVDIADGPALYEGALGELRGVLAAQGVAATGPAGGVYDAELFTEERGRATLFLPCAGPVRPVGRVVPMIVPAVELATIVHVGADREIDRAYGTLAEYVARHELAVDGPIREYYLVDRHDTPDESRWCTEVGWPIFQVGAE
ncbi:MAG TPA: MerR family transcriptional regulator [Actinocrinis sp.]|jgi:DNA-binding transcriptional MerR regulator